MSEKFCGSCGGVRIGESQFCIICGAKFSTEQVRKCPTCHQDWPDAPHATGTSSLSHLPPPPPPPVPPSTPSPAPSVLYQTSHLTHLEAHLEGALNLLARPIKWADSLAKGKDCLNCGCPESAPVCTVCGFTR